MTEGVVTSTFEEDLTYSNAGRLCPNTEAKVFHLETGKELGHNEVFKGGILLFGQRPRRGRSPVEHRGNLSVRPSVRTSVRPSPPFLRASSPSGPILTQILLNSPNPSNMAQI